MKKANLSSLDLFFNNYPNLLCIINKAGHFVTVNPKWQTLLGYLPSELEGKPLSNYIHPDDQSSTNQTIKTLIDTSQKQVLRNRFRHKQGKYHWILWEWFMLQDNLCATAQIESKQADTAKQRENNKLTEYREIIKALKSSEERLKKAQAIGHFGYIEQIVRSHKIWCSSEAMKIFGFPPKEGYITSKSIRNCIDDYDEFLKSYKKLYKTEKRIDVEFSIHPADKSSKRLIRDVIDIEKDINGKPFKIVSIIQDVTSRVNTEQELAETRLLLTTALMQTPVPMVIISTPDFVTRMANDACREVLGIDDEPSIIGKSLMEIKPSWQDYDVNGTPIPFDKAPIFQALRGIESKNKEHIIKRKNNTKRWLSVSASTIRNSEGIITAAYMVFLDITIRKEAELKLAQLAEMHQTILNTTTAGMTFIKDRKFVWVNAFMCTMLGYKMNELINSSTRLLYQNEEDYVKIGKIGYDVIDHGKTYSTEIVLKKRDGSAFWCNLIGNAIEPGKPSSGFIWLLQDITERKKADEEIIKLNNELEKRVLKRTIQLEQANNDLEAFAYSVSHDLRAPIRHIDGFTKLLYSNLSDRSDTINDYYHKITEASRRMSATIDSLLNFSRLGRQGLSLSRVDMNPLIYDIIKERAPDIEKRKIKWNISQLPALECDRSLMKLAFENLISNAIKYTAKRRNAVISIGYRQLSDHYVEVYFKDNGIGFDMAYENKLFGVFQRLHAYGEFDGIGIGLANVRQIIKKHNGTIRAVGKPNKGASFYIMLPVSSNTSAS